MGIDTQPTEPFRFLDLPPEIRNSIYGHCIAQYHGLGPPNVTRVNRQARHESLLMSDASLACFEADLTSAKGMTKFLKWLTTLSDNRVSSIANIEFRMLGTESGTCGVKLARHDHDLTALITLVSQGSAQIDNDETWHSLEDLSVLFGVSKTDIQLKLAYHFCTAYISAYRKMPICKTFEAAGLATPSEIFTNAVGDAKIWTTYNIHLVDQNPACLCQEPMASIWKLLQLHGSRLTKADLRKVAQALFAWNCRTLAKRQKLQREAETEEQPVTHHEAGRCS